MNQVFDFNRTMRFARLKLIQNRKVLLLSILGYFALIFIITFFIAYNITGSDIDALNAFHYGALGFMLIAGTIFLAGMSYQDMNTAEKSIGQIMIPASTFEKYIIPLLSTSLGWIIISVISYELFALIVNGIWSLLFGLHYEAFNFLTVFKNKELLDVFLSYFLLHSIFFLGATAFRKHPIAKTLLAQFIINFAFSVLFMILIMIMFGSFDSHIWGAETPEEAFVETGMITKENLLIMGRWLKAFALGVLPVLLYITAFFKLKEREV